MDLLMQHNTMQNSLYLSSLLWKSQATLQLTNNSGFYFKFN